MNGYKVGNIEECLLKYRYSVNGIGNSHPEQTVYFNYVRKEYKRKNILSEEKFNEFLVSKKCIILVKRQMKYNKYRGKIMFSSCTKKILLTIQCTFIEPIVFISEINRKIRSK